MIKYVTALGKRREIRVGEEKQVKRGSGRCDKEPFEGSSQMLGLLSSAPLESLKYLNLSLPFFHLSVELLPCRPPVNRFDT